MILHNFVLHFRDEQRSEEEDIQDSQENNSVADTEAGFERREQLKQAIFGNNK